MRIDDLKTGDILIFENPQSMHVAMFYQFINRYPYIIHAAEDSNPDKSGIRITLLKQASLENIYAYRLNNDAIALKAAKQLERWSIDKTPFSKKRTELWKTVASLKEHSVLTPKGLENYQDFSTQRFRNSLYRVVKLLARSIHTKPTKEGFHCTEAVILAYQAVGLIKHIKDIIGSDTNPCTWISDKHLEIPDEAYADPTIEEYLEYQATLTDTEFYDYYRSINPSRFDVPAAPSYLCLKSGAIPESEIKRTPIKLEAKSASPALLKFYLKNTPENWHSLGKLQPEEPRPVSPTSYQIWKGQEMTHDLIGQQREDTFLALKFKAPIEPMECKRIRFTHAINTEVQIAKPKTRRSTSLVATQIRQLLISYLSNFTSPENRTEFLMITTLLNTLQKNGLALIKVFIVSQFKERFHCILDTQLVARNKEIFSVISTMDTSFLACFKSRIEVSRGHLSTCTRIMLFQDRLVKSEHERAIVHSAAQRDPNIKNWYEYRPF